LAERRRLRILLIEDNPGDVELIRATFEEARDRDVVLATAERVSTALERLNREEFDAVLLDLGLPDSYGLESLRRIHENATSVPIIVLTGLDYEEMAASALLSGAQDYLIKGQIDSDLLLRSIRYAIERQRAQQELKESEERFRKAVMDSAFPVMIHAEDGEVIGINRIWTEITGYRLEDIRTIDLWIEKAYVEGKEQIRKHLKESYSLSSRADEGEYVIRTKGGGTRTWEFSSTPLGILPDGRRLVMSMASDFTDRKRMEEIIKHQASHDPLTGLPNRILFLDRLKHEMSQARRNGKKFAVLFLDLDRFKDINDTLGHDAGDQLLKDVASRLRDSARESDTISRIGGDEFNILLTDIGQVEDVSVVARKIIAVLQRPFVIADNDFHVTGSIGISIYPDDNQGIEALLKCADIAMYHAKERGRNNYQFYDHSINRKTLERLKLENSLALALKRGEFVLHYQPQIDTATRKVTCIEALIRWNHPELGLLHPAHFVSLAEDTGLIVPIGEWVLRTACTQNKAWQDAGYPEICVTVNLSYRQLRQPGLMEMVPRTLRESGLDPKWLDLEITENTAMRDIDYTTPALMALTEMGVNLSLDDFGTGYSSLAHIKKLPIHKIKIDRSFISDLTDNADDMAIVNAVISLTHNLRLRVLAEGVETEEQFSFLKSNDCDEVQGYLFGEPLPADRIESLLGSPYKGAA